MADIHLKQTHQLSRDEARQRLQGIAEDLKMKLSFDYGWKGDVLHFKRSGASGVIKLGDGYIDVRVKLGMLLAPMRGRIKESIEENIRTALG